MSENILSEPKEREITLADNKIYKLSPLDLNTLAKLEEVFSCSLDKLIEEFEKRQASAFRKLLFTLLQENYPELTLQDVGKLVPLEKLGELGNILSEVVTASFSS